MGTLRGYLTIKAFAAIFKTSRKNVEYWVRSGHLKAVKVSPRCYLIPAATVNGFQRPKKGAPRQTS